MLEMVKQLTLATAPQQSAATSQRIGQDDRQAGLFEKLFGHADTAKTDKPDKPPRVEDDRPELSSGLDTADHATTVA
ncbi:MAG: hypothetical protein HQ546_02810, partial [Planctomycetes bacterium]|nr:hypothetical protein [Planctomycetota bacterium]